MEVLFTPWRSDYLSGGGYSGSECFFCRAASEEDGARENLVLTRTPYHVVLLNRYPYTNGHLMVAPRRHVADPEECSPGARHELWPLMLRCRRALREAYGPEGFNLGANLGSAAGAGVPDHFHLHLLPRWSGDTNFMTTAGGTRLIPEDLGSTWERLRPLLRTEEG